MHSDIAGKYATPSWSFGVTQSPGWSFGVTQSGDYGEACTQSPGWSFGVTQSGDYGEACQSLERQRYDYTLFRGCEPC
jgi:hypothetical protein